MPFRKRKQIKKTFRKKPTIFKMEKQIKKIMKMDKPETKYADSYIASPISFSYAGSTVYSPTAGISQGTADNGSRIGDKIRMLSLAGQFSLVGNGSNANVATWCRLIVFKSRNENITTPTVGQILSSTFISTVNAPFATKTWDFKSTYQVLYEKRFMVTSGGALSSSSQPMKEIKFFKKLNHVCKYTGAGTATVDGGIWYFWISDSATNLPEVLQGTIRITFSDA